ncbi:MAG: hypothetical protein MUE50_17285 [Pirellulaceae bacterium]|nr:hypothetical protein [Pirellulaceae bacterium]
MKRHPAQRFQIGDLGPRKPEGLQRQAAQRAEVCDPGRSEPPTGGAFEEEDEEDDLRSNRSTNFVSMAG